jgi:hypothetical protein
MCVARVRIDLKRAGQSVTNAQAECRYSGGTESNTPANVHTRFRDSADCVDTANATAINTINLNFIFGSL